jgi:transcriptional regulator with XRE-family HTH domain
MKNSNSNKPIIGVNNYVEHSMSILDRIHELLQKKFDGKQIDLANKLGKSESEISKWLNGVQNFTIFTISKLEEAFGESIIAVCTDSDNSTFVQVKVTSFNNHTMLEVEDNGKMVEVTTKYEDLNTSLISETLSNILV